MGGGDAPPPISAISQLQLLLAGRGETQVLSISVCLEHFALKDAVRLT